MPVTRLAEDDEQVIAQATVIVKAIHDSITRHGTDRAQHLKKICVFARTLDQANPRRIDHKFNWLATKLTDNASSTDGDRIVRQVIEKREATRTAGFSKKAKKKAVDEALTKERPGYDTQRICSLHLETVTNIVIKQISVYLRTYCFDFKILDVMEELLVHEASALLWCFYIIREQLPVHSQISVSYYEERPEHWLPPNDSGRWYLTDIFTVNKYVADNCRKELEGINYERSFSSLKYRIEPLRLPLARSLSDSLTGTSSHLSVATSDTVTDMPSSSEGTSERAYPTIIELIDHDHQFQSVGLLRALYGPVSSPPEFDDSESEDDATDPFLQDITLFKRPTEEEVEVKNTILKYHQAHLDENSERFHTVRHDRRQERLRQAEEERQERQAEREQSRQTLMILQTLQSQVSVIQEDRAQDRRLRDMDTQAFVQSMASLRVIVMAEAAKESQLPAPAGGERAVVHAETLRKERNAFAHGIARKPNAVVKDMGCALHFKSSVDQDRQIVQPIDPLYIFERSYNINADLIRPLLNLDDATLPARLDIDWSGECRELISDLCTIQMHAFSSLLTLQANNRVRDRWVTHFQAHCTPSHQTLFGYNYVSFYNTPPPGSYLLKCLSNLVPQKVNFQNLVATWKTDVPELNTNHAECLIGTMAGSTSLAFPNLDAIQKFFDRAKEAAERFLELIQKTRVTRQRLLEEYCEENNLPIDRASIELEPSELVRWIRLRVESDRTRFRFAAEWMPFKDRCLVMCAINYYFKCCWEPVRGMEESPAFYSPTLTSDVHTAFNARLRDIADWPVEYHPI